MTKFGALLATTFLMLASFVGAATPAQAAPGALAEPCADIEVVLARGSGQEVTNSTEMNNFLRDLKDDLSADLAIHPYELGSEAQNGYQYPAVNVARWQNGNALGAGFSGGYMFDYGRSVEEGRQEMLFYAKNRAAR